VGNNFENINNFESGLEIPYFTALDFKILGLHFFCDLRENGA
jgi:hypothetical protein